MKQHICFVNKYFQARSNASTMIYKCTSGFTQLSTMCLQEGHLYNVRRRCRTQRTIDKLQKFVPGFLIIYSQGFSILMWLHCYQMP